MKRKIGLLMTLVISALLIASVFGVIVTNVRATPPSLEVVKEVWNGSSWVNEINANNGDTVAFRITVTYHNVTQPQYQHYAENITINDTLPVGLAYVVGSATPFEPVVSGNLLTWNLGSTKLYDGQSYVVTFNATVSGEGGLINLAESEADEHCTGQHITGSDTATVNVNAPTPGISVEKWVTINECDWYKEIYAYQNTDVTFKIIVTNTGDATLEVYVNDTLPDGLEYNDSATVDGIPLEPDIIDGILVWHFISVEPNDVIEIQFKATVVGEPCSENINSVEVVGLSCSDPVTDSDTARVFVNGMCVQKQVWNGQEWADETDASVGDTVRFNITITYYGDLTLKQIKVIDVLPDCLSYADNAVPEDPEVSSDNKTLWWNFSSVYILHNGESLSIEFDADVIYNNCQPAENWAYVWAKECGIHDMYGNDSAAVNIGCDLAADAGGPYSGDVNQNITITGSATGGIKPYTFAWDLDNDGQYDDATGAVITHSWNKEGTYIIWLKVTDADGKTDTDYASVTIGGGGNKPPNKPDIRGPSTGKPGVKYEYTITATDPNDDNVYYYIDWGDGNNSGWLGPFDSGSSQKVGHTWDSKGSYTITAKAKDIYNAEGPTGTLRVNMPRNRAIYNLLFKLMERFPILERLLRLL